MLPDTALKLVRLVGSVCGPRDLIALLGPKATGHGAKPYRPGSMATDQAEIDLAVSP